MKAQQNCRTTTESVLHHEYETKKLSRRVEKSNKKVVMKSRNDLKI